MTQLHSITFEEIDRYLSGTAQFTTVYLFHSKDHPSLFELCEVSPFRKEKQTTYTIKNVPARIVGYSTDVPIIVQRDGKYIAVLLPDYNGELVLMPTEDSPWPPSVSTRTPEERNKIKIAAFSADSTLQFLMFPNIEE